MNFAPDPSAAGGDGAGTAAPGQIPIGLATGSADPGPPSRPKS